MLSEWNTLWPSLYAADMPVVIAAYGLGLQGWAGSFQFNSHAGPTAWSPVSVTLPWGRLEVDVPNIFGQYPIISRMVQRGDIKGGPVISVRRVSDRALATGAFDFEEKIVQEGPNGDIKSFAGTVPQAALAVGRTLVEFTGADEKPSTPPDLAANGKDGVWKSATGELTWDTANRVVVIDTAGTQGIAGFGGNKEWKLGSFGVFPTSPYASILLTAAGRQENLANCRTALVSAVARVANTGTEISLLDGAMDTVLDKGPAPVVMEPVRATVRPARKPAKVEVLDHDGRRSGRTLPVAGDGSFAIDTGRDGGWLYEITY